VLVVERASTTSRADELDIGVVKVMGEREGKGRGLFERRGVHWGFECKLIVCQCAIVLHNCVAHLVICLS